MKTRILVTYGSKRGGTAAIAEQIAATLRESGCEVEWLPLSSVSDPSTFEAQHVAVVLKAAQASRGRTNTMFQG